MIMTTQNFCSWEEAVSWLISQPDQQDLMLACYYDQPLQVAADRYWKSEEWQAIRACLPRTVGQVLDIGAGHGISSYALAREGWQVSALEPDPSDLVGVGAIRKLANGCSLPIAVTQEFGEKLPFPSDSFDLVFARQVLHHAHDLRQLCREVHRVLKPGGLFIAVRDHVISSKQDLNQFFEIHPLHKFYGGENAFLLKEYITAITASNLHVNQIIKPFDSIINYAPRTKVELKLEIQKKFERFPFGKLVSKVLLNGIFFDLFLKILNGIDQRPGRLYSFIAHKPNEEV